MAKSVNHLGPKPILYRPKDTLSCLLASLRPVFHPKPSLGGGDIPSHTTGRSNQLVPSGPKVDRSLSADSSAVREHLIDLVSHLPPLLPDSCEWLEEGALKIIGKRPIDAGSVADVWVGVMGSRKVAIKSYRYCSSSDYLPTYMRFYKEALACSRLKGQNIVSFIGIYSTLEFPSALAFEFMDPLNLREYLRDNRDARRLDLLLDILRGVESMHIINIVHGNLKSTNILIDSEGHARIAGLGVALISSPMPGVDIDRFFHGAAPELVDAQHVGSSGTGATKASDVYALAVLAWEIFAGDFPFSQEGNVAAVFSMLIGRRPARPDHPELSNRLWKTIKKCWDPDPARRKTITAIVAVVESEVTAHQSRSHMSCQDQT